MCPRHSSESCFHAVCPRVVCLPPLQKQHNALWALKFPAFSPATCRNSQNLASLTFQANCYGDSFSPGTPVSAGLSLPFLCKHSFLPTAANDPFLSHTVSPHFPPFSGGLFSAFGCGVSSASLRGNFWGMEDDLLSEVIRLGR